MLSRWHPFPRSSHTTMAQAFYLNWKEYILQTTRGMACSILFMQYNSCCNCNTVHTLSLWDWDWRRVPQAPVQHVFHACCVDDWLRRRADCPMCTTIMEYPIHILMSVDWFLERPGINGISMFLRGLSEKLEDSAGCAYARAHKVISSKHEQSNIWSRK